MKENDEKALLIADDLILQLFDHAKNIIAGSDEIDEHDQKIANACAEYLKLRTLKT